MVRPYQLVRSWLAIVHVGSACVALSDQKILERDKRAGHNDGPAMVRNGSRSLHGPDDPSGESRAPSALAAPRAVRYRAPVTGERRAYVTQSQ